MPFPPAYPDVDPIPSPGPIHPSIGDIQLDSDGEYDILSEGDSEFEIVPNPVANGIVEINQDHLKNGLAALTITSEDDTESAYGGIEENAAVGTSSRVDDKDDTQDKQDKDVNKFKCTLNKGTDKEEHHEENVRLEDRYQDSTKREPLPYEDNGCKSNAKGKYKDDPLGDNDSVGPGRVNAVENGRNESGQDDTFDLPHHQRARRSRNHPPSAPFLRPATPEFAFSPVPPPAPINLPKSASRSLERPNMPSGSNLETNHAYPPPLASRSGTSKSVSSIRSYVTARTSSSSVIVTDDITAEQEPWTSTSPGDLHEELAVSEAEREAAIRAAAFAGAALERERAAHRAALHTHETERRMSEERSSNLSELQQRYRFLEHEHEETLGRVQRLHKALRATEDARDKALLQNSALKAQNNTLRKEHDDLQKSHVKLEKSHDVLHLCHENVDQRREVLQQSHQTLYQAHNELQRNHDELLRSHALLQATHRNLRVRHETLKETHTDLQNRHGAVQKHHEKSQMHVDPPSATFKAFPGHLQKRVERFEMDFWDQDPVGRAMSHEASRVKAWSNGFQRAFLSSATLPRADEMIIFDEVLTTIENYGVMRVEYLLYTKIHKVMRKIAALDNIPGNDKFHITNRAEKLAKQWELMIEKAKPNNNVAATDDRAGTGVAPPGPWVPANGIDRNSNAHEQVDYGHAKLRGFESERAAQKAPAGHAQLLEHPSVDSGRPHIEPNTSSAVGAPSWVPDDSTMATGTTRHLKINQERLGLPPTRDSTDGLPRERELTVARDHDRARLEKRARRKATVHAHDKVPPGVKRPSFTRLRGKPHRSLEVAKPGRRYSLERLTWKFDDRGHPNEVNEDARGGDDPALTELISAKMVSQQELDQPEQSSSQFEDCPSVDTSVKGDGPEANDLDSLQLYPAYCRSLEDHSKTPSDPTPGRKGKERERMEQGTGKDDNGAKVLNHARERKDEQQHVGDSSSVQVPMPRNAPDVNNNGPRFSEWNAPRAGPSRQAPLRRTPTIPPLSIPRGGVFSQNRKSSSGYGSLFSRCATSPNATDAPSISLMEVVPTNPAQLPASQPAIDPIDPSPATAVPAAPAQPGIPRTTALPSLPAAATVQRPREESQGYRQSQITPALYPRPAARDTTHEARYATINWARAQRRRTTDGQVTGVDQLGDLPGSSGFAPHAAHERTSIAAAPSVGVTPSTTVPTAVATQRAAPRRAAVPHQVVVPRPVAVPTQVPGNALGANGSMQSEVNDSVIGTDRRPRMVAIKFAAHEAATWNGRPVTKRAPVAHAALPASLPAAAPSSGLLQVPGQAAAVATDADPNRAERSRRGTTASDPPRFADSLHRRLLEVKRAEGRGDGRGRGGVNAS